jgi:hypothetical protein
VPAPPIGLYLTNWTYRENAGALPPPHDSPGHRPGGRVPSGVASDAWVRSHLTLARALAGRHHGQVSSCGQVLLQQSVGEHVASADPAQQDSAVGVLEEAQKVAGQ